MASGYTTATANAIIDDQFGTAVRTAPTTPMKLSLETVAGTAAAAGTEATGYTRPTIAFAAASGQATSNSGALSVAFTASNTVVAVAVFDSAGTPVRKAFGPLTTSRSVVNGDTLSFAIGAVTFNLTSP